MGVKRLVAQYHVARMRRRLKPMPFSIPSDLLKVKAILICLPAGLRELTLVKQFLPLIHQLFARVDVALLTTPGLPVTDMYPRKGFQILSPSINDLGWSGFPKQSFLTGLQKQNFDMILDLTIEPSVFTSSVLLSFPGAIRVGRGNHLGQPYYNLEIKTKYLRDERNIYRSLLETLAELMNRPLQPQPSTDSL